MTNAPILVLGGTGKTGRRVVASLTRLGVPVRAVSRGTTPRFDWASPDTWTTVLDGARAVYLVEPDEGEVPLAEFSTLAVELGVRRQVLLSARSHDAANAALKEPSEHAVRASGAAWTVLRPAWFSQNFAELPLLAEPLAAGDLRLPTGGGREPFVDTRDIADVAARALVDDGHEGRTYELTGPESRTFGEAVAAYAAATGRDLRYTPLTEEEYAAEQAAAGVPEPVITLMLGLFREIREGTSEGVTDDVREVLGRGPRPFDAWLRDRGTESGGALT